MRVNIIIKRILLGVIVSVCLLSCSKKTDNVDVPTNPYKTSAGKLLTATDSVNGELGEPDAEVIYSVKGLGQGISFKCYDQTTNFSDTSYADIAVYFAFTKQDLLAGNYKETLYPIKNAFESKNFGIQDSIYLKVVKDARSSVNDPMGKFSITVVQRTMEIATAKSLLVNDVDYTTVNQNEKGASGKYYEQWYKASVTPGTKYYLRFLKSYDDGVYTLNSFNCEFYDKDGITVHAGTDIVKGGNQTSALDGTYYVEYTVPAGQPYLYIKCFNPIVGTNGIKLVDTKP